MIKIGSYNELEVIKKTNIGIYLGTQAESVFLPQRKVPANTQIGDKLTVFVYTDSQDRPIATTERPKAAAGEFACLRVMDVTPFGVFMDWGLDKDLLVPFKHQHQRMEKGRKYVVRLCLDEKTNRVIGVSKLNQFLSDKPVDIKEGQKVSLLVYGFMEVGMMVIVDHKYAGLLYRNEVFEKLFIGDEREGYVKKIREDGKIDVSLQKQGHLAIDDSKTAVLAALEKSSGFLPYHDKSDPEDIKHIFKMSKKAFKKAIGGLYKDKKIKISEEGIHGL